MRFRSLARLGVGLALLLATAAPVRAQYFGQNKIRYRDFVFAILSTQHFDVYYYPVERAAAREAALLAERWYTVISRRLRHQLRQRQPLVLYASHADFAQTNIVDGWVGESTGGLTEAQRQRIVLPLGPGLAETNHVLAHELVHAFQYDMARHGHPSVLAMPLWFIEGMAELLSRPADDRQTAMWMRDAISTDIFPTVQRLAEPRYFPYRYGHSFWTFLARRFGDDVVRRLLVARDEDVAARLQSVTGMDANTLSRAWRTWAEEAYARPDDRDEEADRPGPGKPRLVITRGKAGRINVGPALSPDGRQIAFVSEKDLFSIEVFLSDAATGRVLRKLVGRATNPHFDSLQFVESSGTWSPEGRRFAFAAVRAGVPVIVVLDVPTGRTSREIPFPLLGQVWNPAWSPDGRAIAFTGSQGGRCDLFVHDVGSGATERLTRDAFADLQPAWSPDGRRLAFVSDRFSTDLKGLRPGTYQLALMDLATRSVTRVAAAGRGSSITPQFGSDGRRVFFVSDADGIPNVYVLDLATQAVTRVTNFDTGVAGITPLSPAISVSASRLAYSVYGRGGYEIGVLDLRSVSDAAPVTLPPPSAVPHASESHGVTPSRAEAEVPSFFRERPYRGRLSLDGIGQPYLSAGGGAFGAFFHAGIVMSFADMLGDQALYLALQGGRRPEDFAGRALYLNRSSRWNWGMEADFIPAVVARTGSQYLAGAGTVPHTAEDRRRSYAGLSALALYPFNRASRLEFSFGLRRIGFGQENERIAVPAASGDTVTTPSESPPPAHPIRLAEASVALVYDSAIRGPTSPLVGRRYRFEIAPSVGDLQFATLLADFRQYLMPLRPFTLAFRARYIARVGRDADDPRLMPLVLSLRDQARGYDLGMIAAGTCAAAPGTPCSALDALTGSRLATANAEVRFPIAGVVSRSLRYGPLPIEGFAFADLAALRTRAPGLSDGWGSQALRSAGAGVRAGAAGVVFEFAAARPFDRRDGGWRFTFNMVPGF